MADFDIIYFWNSGCQSIYFLYLEAHMRHAYVTGSAGFIGFYLSEFLLQEGWSVTGLDGLTDYDDVHLKQRRL